MYNQFVVKSDILIENLKIIRERIGKSLLCFVLKDNAYGHGLVQIALNTESYVDYFAVFDLVEAIKLKKLVKKPVIAFDYLMSEDDIRRAIEYDIEFFVSSLSQIETVYKETRSTAKTAYVHLFVDTGLGREGVNLADIEPVTKKLLQYEGNIQVGYLMSHFASPNITNKANKQIQVMQTAKSIVKEHGLVFDGVSFSASEAVTAGIYFDMVRVGALPYYGDGREIKPIGTLLSEVLFVKSLKAGDSISYNSTHTLEKDEKVAVIGIGYRHGLRRSLSNKLEFTIRGKKFKQVGTICMDQCMAIVDNEVAIGDNVTIFDDVNVISKLADTIPYEITTGLKGKIKKILI